jgi:oligoribonuclease NrnB/cAMP/cGMP phosphodiesterase (DHH superfamily)
MNPRIDSAILPPGEKAMDRPLVLHHSDNDGFCAAWVLRKYFHNEHNLDIEAVPVQYGQEPPSVEDRDTYIVDFSYDRETLEAMNQKAHRLMVMDHHVTAEAELADLDYCYFEEGKSGGLITWEQFFPLAVEEPPWLVRYTDDHDLWKFDLPYSKAIRAFLQSHPHNFVLWDRIENRLIADDQNLITEGEAIYRYQKKMIHILSSKYRMVDIGGHRVKCTNASIPYLFSEVCHKLAEAMPFGATWFAREDGQFVYSICSQEDGVDVSEIATQYGGGGHTRAAGFTTDRIL